MIESIRPRLNRVKYAAVLLGAVAVAASPPVGMSAVATAEPTAEHGTSRITRVA